MEIKQLKLENIGRFRSLIHSFLQLDGDDNSLTQADFRPVTTAGGKSPAGRRSFAMMPAASNQNLRYVMRLFPAFGDPVC